MAKMPVALLYGKLSLHAQRFWLNNDAPHSIHRMSFTEEMSQEEMLLLNLEASANIAYMFLTFEVFHDERSPAKDDAP